MNCSVILKKIALTFILCILVISYFGTINVNATTDFYDSDLYSYTNTYDYSYDGKTPNIGRYNLESRNDNLVDNGDPLVTVLTHGLGEKAASWSNKYNTKELDNGHYIFAYNSDSIISRLVRKTDCEIYWVKINRNQSLEMRFEMRIITPEVKQCIKEEKNMDYNGTVVSNIVDISKHSVVVFEASNYATGMDNDTVYTEFNYAVSRLVKDIKNLNNGRLPRINLIGHSRGGITNMQYALDHPDLVASIYSLGTPYLGTTSGAVGYAFKPSLLCSDQAANDILNPSVYESYMKRWNEGYDDYYKNIKVNAFAGYSTGDQIISLLATDALWEEFIDGYSTWNEYAKSSFKAGAVSIAEAGYVLMMKSLFTGGVMTKIAVEKLLTGILNEIINNISIDSSKIPVFDFVQILTNEINFDYHFPFISWYNDGCVDLGSALGYKGLVPLGDKEYRGFNRVIKAFTSFNCNYLNLIEDAPAVPHNMESMDKELVGYIVQDINLGNSTNDYLVREIYTSEGNSTNEVYIDQFLGDVETNTLVIPEYIYGKKVVGISDYAFANNFYGRSNITKVVIPDSIKHIGKNAFYNSDNITEIEIGENGSLETIDDYAFAQIPNLTSINIPSEVYSISSNAFSHSSITSFTCYNNPVYEWKNDVLISKNVILSGYEQTYKAIYINPNVDSIRIPDNVRIIGEELFKYNYNIKNIDFNEVIYIGVEAFAFSGLENIVNDSHIETVEDRAFDGTPWLINQTDDLIVLGNTLISCNKDLEYIVIDGNISMINGNSFTSNAKGIIIGESVERIGENAFVNCPNLEWILFTSNKQVYLSNNIVNDNVKIYVPAPYLEKYKKFETFSYLKDRLETKKITVTFDYGDDSEEIMVEYYQTFDNYIEAPDITGMDFTNWNVKGDSVKTIEPYDIFEFYEDSIILEPNYEKSKYYIDFRNDENLYSLYLTYGDKVDININFKDGYEFIGWFNQNDEQVIDSNGNVFWGKLNRSDVLIAKYQAILYFINYILNGGDIDDELQIIEFSADKKINHSDLIEPIKFGYIFDCWFLDGYKFESTEGIFCDITLEARWLGNEVYIDSKRQGNIEVADEYSILNMSNCREYGNFVIRVDSGVTTITIMGGDISIHNFRMIINQRSIPLIIGLDSIKITAPYNSGGNGYNTIEYYGDQKIFLTVKGLVEITGGIGASGHSYYSTPSPATDNRSGRNGINGGSGCDGGSGIRVFSLEINSFDSNSSLKVYGGAGGLGGKAEQGQKGSNGVNSPSGWFWGPVKGDNGSDGGNGGQGGNGGNGGYAIAVDGLNNLYISKDLVCEFVGGAGGEGGWGGDGGSGGAGASDISSDIWHGVGDPGDGGNGGNGGQGGNGGNGSKATNANYINGLGGDAGIGGTGGYGGFGGTGGDAGDFGDGGSNGNPGQNGSAGLKGKSGSSGKDTYGDERGINNNSYMFTKLFIAHVLN